VQGQLLHRGGEDDDLGCAAQAIDQGEELTYDYNTEETKTIPCKCRPLQTRL
jgi:hypothetical protein